MWRTVLLLFAALATLPQTHCDEDKRSYSSLARNGDLPFYARTYNKKMHPMVSTGKRYVGALAKTGGLPYGKRGDDTDNEELLRELWSELEEKRSVASLARSGALQGKRSVEALARAGYLPQAKQPQESEEYSHDSSENSDEMKRNIGSMARNGYLKRDGDELDELMEELYEKRNVASLMRNGISPFAPQGKRYLGSLMRNQRNIGAMARNWHLPEHLKFGKRDDDDLTDEGDVDEEDLEDVAKRYVATLLRHGRLPVGGVASGDNMSEDKRHIGSLASKGFQVHKKSVRSAGSEESAYNSTVKIEENKRSKRQATYLANDEFPMPVLQNSELFDYEDLAEVLSGGAAPEKRFLGSVARNGWFRDNGNHMTHTSTMQKRHIGSLARLGWLPAFRSSRYSRSGRASPAPPDEEEEHSRENSTDGEEPTPDESTLWPPASSFQKHLKRFLLLPAVDNILLRRLYAHRI